MWLEAVEGLSKATTRMQERARQFPGRYFVYRAEEKTVLAAVDSLAATAGLVMGKTSRTPAVLIRGFPWEETESNTAMLLRAPQKDLFL